MDPSTHPRTAEPASADTEPLSGAALHALEADKPGSLEETFLRFEVSIKRFLGRFLYRSEDVDEIAQETFLRAYDASQQREIQSPKSYLFQVAKNIALKELTRKSARMTDYLEDAIAANEQVLDGADSLEDELIAQQKISGYCDAIASLPPQCRKVFMLRKVQAMSHKDIAAAMNISISSVEKHMALGIVKFETYMQERENKEQQQYETGYPSKEPV